VVPLVDTGIDALQKAAGGGLKRTRVRKGGSVVMSQIGDKTFVGSDALPSHASLAAIPQMIISHHGEGLNNISLPQMCPHCAGTGLENGLVGLGLNRAINPTIDVVTYHVKPHRVAGGTLRGGVAVPIVSEATASAVKKYGLHNVLSAAAVGNGNGTLQGGSMMALGGSMHGLGLNCGGVKDGSFIRQDK
jgi:hypothetical protein